MTQDSFESVPETIGIAVLDEGDKIMGPIFEKGTKIPPGGITEAKRGYKKRDVDATAIGLNIYKGDEELVEQNTQLGSITFDNLERGADPEFEIEFTLKQDGQLSAKMKNLDTGEVVSIATIGIQS